MLNGELSYFEGAAEVLRIDLRLIGIPERDPDLQKFVLIRSGTDHLPLKQQQELWSAEALSRLRDEFAQTERWAESFAAEACRDLIERLEVNQQS